MSPQYPDEHPVHLARKAKGWRLEDLASKAECSKPLLSNIERGYLPPLARRNSIAAALECTVESLWPPEQIA